MLSEILALAKAGYKKKDIDEILKMEAGKKDDNENLQKPKDETQGAPVDDGTGKQDFEALYNETLKKLSDVEAKLTKAQADNRSEGAFTTPTIDDEFKKLSELLNG